MDLGLHSIVGKVREVDEDSIMAASHESLSKDDSSYSCLCALADGMGGGSRGEVASRLAVDEFWDTTKQLLVGQGLLEKEKIRKTILEGVKQANKAVYGYKVKNGIDQIGTTLTTAFMVGGDVYVSNVGDSRTYIIAEGRVEERTKDHSYVQELVDAKQITAEEARNHPRRNVITRVLGEGPEIESDFYEWKLYNGDTILLCCDGLWEALGDDTICKFASAKLSAHELVKEMVSKANELDGSDNISAIIVRPSVGITKEVVLGRTTEVRRKGHA